MHTHNAAVAGWMAGLAHNYTIARVRNAGKGIIKFTDSQPNPTQTNYEFISVCMQTMGLHH